MWWHHRAQFEVLLQTAKQMREGDLSVTATHREYLTKLLAHAQKVLTEGGNAAGPATLRRVGTTLSAIAARGGFEPEPAGALTDDRDPPGFEAAGIPALVVAAPPPKAELKLVPTPPPIDPEFERLKREERLRRDAEVAAIRDEISGLQKQVMEAEGRLISARARVAKLELNEG